MKEAGKEVEEGRQLMKWTIRGEAFRMCFTNGMIRLGCRLPRDWFWSRLYDLEYMTARRYSFQGNYTLPCCNILSPRHFDLTTHSSLTACNRRENTQQVIRHHFFHEEMIPRFLHNAALLFFFISFLNPVTCGAIYHNRELSVG